MTRRAARRGSRPPQPDLAAGYDVQHGDGVLRLVPLANVGPGWRARFACLAGFVFGLACLAGGLYIGYSNQARMADRDFGPPAWTAWIVPGGILLVLAALTFAGCLKLAVAFGRPLVVEANGHVRYGSRVLTAAGGVTEVRLDRRSRWHKGPGQHFQHKWAHLYLSTPDGRYVELPGPYFSDIEGWELAESLAAAVAARLRVPLTLEPPPAPHSALDRFAVWEIVWGAVALTVGGAQFLFGFVILALVTGSLLGPAARHPHQLPPWWVAAFFLAFGSAACWLGCRSVRGGWRAWLLVLACLVGLGGCGLLAVRWLG